MNEEKRRLVEEAWDLRRRMRAHADKLSEAVSRLSRLSADKEREHDLRTIESELAASRAQELHFDAEAMRCRADVLWFEAVLTHRGNPAIAWDDYTKRTACRFGDGTEFKE